MIDDDRLIALAYRAGLLTQLQVLTAVHPEKVDTKAVVGLATASVLAFGRAVADHCAGEATDD